MEIAMEGNPYVEVVLRWYSAAPWVGLLLLFMVADMVSGVLASMYERQLSSKIGFRGVMKKAMVLLVVGAGCLVELAILATLPKVLQDQVPIPIAKVLAGFFSFNEALSILENARRCGVPLPAFLTKSLMDTLGKINQLGGGASTEQLTIRAVVQHEPGLVPAAPVAPVVQPDPPTHAPT